MATSRTVTSLGGTEIADPAVIKGDIDLYPEYTGTAYSVVLKKTGAADRRPGLRHDQDGVPGAAASWP